MVSQFLWIGAMPATRATLFSMQFVPAQDVFPFPLPMLGTDILHLFVLKTSPPALAISNHSLSMEAVTIRWIRSNHQNEEFLRECYACRECFHDAPFDLIVATRINEIHSKNSRSSFPQGPKMSLADHRERSKADGPIRRPGGEPTPDRSQTISIKLKPFCFQMAALPYYKPMTLTTRSSSCATACAASYSARNWRNE